MTLGALLNHLLQSTAFAALAALLVFGLRKNRARVRFAVWLAASMKFLLPFALLAAVGSYIPRPARNVPAPPPRLVEVVDAAQPFAPSGRLDILPEPAPVSVPLLTPAASAPVRHPPFAEILFAVWLCGFLAVCLRWVVRWLRLYRIVAQSRPAVPALTASLSLPVRITAATLEPGVFGIFRPVLLLPAGIVERLGKTQLESIVAHEVCHVRRRDNLTAALHMAVESAFWFHPMVWWIGRRMVEERELACDEAVLAVGGDAEDYAQGVVQVCGYYLESPLECVSGVTGADLKRRIVAIMSHPLRRRLGYGQKALLAATAGLAVALPLAAGLTLSLPVPRTALAATLPHAPAAQPPTIPTRQALLQPNDLPKFATVRFRVSPCGEYDGGSAVWDRKSGTLAMSNVSMRFLLAWAFSGRLSAKFDQFVVGGPAWLGNDDSLHFDIYVKAAAPVASEQFQKMVQALLTARAGLVTHAESRPLPAYVLRQGKNASRLKPATASEASACKYGRTIAPGVIDVTCTNKTMADLADTVLTAGLWADDSPFPDPVRDATGLKGAYDFSLRYRYQPQLRLPSSPDYDPAIDVSLSDAVARQLGLDLAREPRLAQVTVVDAVNPSPTPDPPGVDATIPASPAAFEVADIRPSGPDTPDDDYDRTLPSGQIEWHRKTISAGRRNLWVSERHQWVG